MGYATIGAKGAVTSWGSSGDDVYQLLQAIGFSEANLSAMSAQLDDTVFSGSGVSSMSQKAGLGEWSVTLTGLYPKATRKLGNGGLVTYAAGEVLHVKGWNLNIETQELDITEQASSPVLWKAYRPGIIKWGGDFEGHVDSGTNVAGVTLAGTAASAMTLKVTEEGATDSSLSGSAFIHALDVGIQVGSTTPNTKKYAFTGSGDLTHTFPTGLGLTSTSSPAVIAPSSWDADSDGVADRSLVFQADSGRTFTGNAFWKSIAISNQLNDLIKIVVGIRGSGALTIA